MMSKHNLPKSAFQLMDEQDEMQIISDSNVQQSLVYEVQGKKTLSYSGIKFLFQKWTEEKSLTVQIIHDQSYCNLDKDNPDDKNTWQWRAQFTLKTTRITEDGKAQSIETQGHSESLYHFNGKYDSFGKTKAFSKAERNADRKQIPEFEITHMINNVINPENIQNLKHTQNTTPGPVAENYLQTLHSLGYTGPQPKTSFEATKIIEKLKNSGECKKYCSCDKPIPNSINGQTCQTCKKLLEVTQ